MKFAVKLFLILALSVGVFAAENDININQIVGGAPKQRVVPGANAVTDAATFLSAIGAQARNHSQTNLTAITSGSTLTPVSYVFYKGSLSANRTLNFPTHAAGQWFVFEAITVSSAPVLTFSENIYVRGQAASTVGSLTLVNGKGTYVFVDDGTNWTVSDGTVNGATEITGAVGVNHGGTGATTASGAFDAIHSAEASVASAATTDLGAVASDKVSITGTATITSFGTAPAGTFRQGRFTSTATLTYNATSLILPTAATNITTAAGDRFQAYSLGSGNWVVSSYTKANGGITPAGSTGDIQYNNGGVLGSYDLATLSGLIFSQTISTATITTMNVTSFSIKTDALQAPMFAADAGGSDAYVVTYSPAITAYVAGVSYRFKANTVNTGAASININGVGVVSIKKWSSGSLVDPADGDIPAGEWANLVYNGTYMVLQNPRTVSSGSAATPLAGGFEYARVAKAPAQGTTWNLFGGMVTTATGTASNTTTTSSTFGEITYTQAAATTDTDAGWEAGTTTSNWSENPTISIKAKLTSQAAGSIRCFIGACSGSPMGGDQTAVGGLHFAMFRYSTSAGDANWKCITSGNVAVTTTDSGVVADANWHWFTIVKSSSDVKFYIDGTLVATHTTNIPGADIVRASAVQRTLANATKSIAIAYVKEGIVIP